MQIFENLKLGDFFTLERNLYKQPDRQMLWQKKSSRTAWQHSYDRNRWFYFSKKEIVYGVKQWIKNY